MRQVLPLAFLTGLFLTKAAVATCPLLDLVEHKGKNYPLALYTNPPHNAKYAEWVSGLPHCSAPGQGRAVYRVEDQAVYLVKFRGCGSELGVSQAYGAAAPKVLAVWLNGKIDVARGSCHGGWDPAKEWFTVNQGQLIEFVQAP